jgi:cell division protein ZapA
MPKQSVDVSVAGHDYRLVTTLDADTLRRMARSIERRLERLAPGQQLHPQALLLVALSLAHELELEQAKHESLTERSRGMLQELLSRVESALGSVDENGEPLSRRDGSAEAE